MKKFLLVSLLFVSFFTHSTAQIGLPPAGYFDMILVFPPEASATYINGIKTSFRATELAVTPVTKARLWRMATTSARAGIPAGSSYSYISPTDAVDRVRGSTSGVGGGALVQLDAKTQIPEGNFTAGAVKKQGTNIPITMDCKSDIEYLMPNTAIGANKVKVAILDTGLDCNEAGSPVVFVNPILSRYTEAADAKSFIEYPNPRDKVSGHGTAVASLIIRAFVNASNVNCRIVPIKVLGGKGEGTLFILIQGIDHAIQKNVDIINISIISPDNTKYTTKTPIELALELAQNKNILVVSAAGNEGDNIDERAQYVYPACAKNDLQIVAGAAKCSDDIASFSSYGKENVDIFAPGVGVLVQKLYSTTWQPADGTSYATPIVAGMAAVLRTRQTSRNAETLKCAIMKGAITSSAFAGKCVSGGSISSSGALRYFEKCSK